MLTPFNISKKKNSLQITHKHKTHITTPQNFIQPPTHPCRKLTRFFRSISILFTINYPFLDVVVFLCFLFICTSVFIFDLIFQLYFVSVSFFFSEKNSSNCLTALTQWKFLFKFNQAKRSCAAALSVTDKQKLSLKKLLYFAVVNFAKHL